MLNAGLRLRHHRQPHQGVEADPQLLPFLIAAQGEGFLEILEGEGIGVRQLVEQVSDRELHRGVEAGSGRTRLECGRERQLGVGPSGGFAWPGLQSGQGGDAGLAGAWEA